MKTKKPTAPKKPKTGKQNRKVRSSGLVRRDIAHKIADSLFVDGSTGNKAEFLQLWKGGNYMCGWSYECAVDQIRYALLFV